MDKQLWNVFVQTGNVEAYLLLKHLEKKDNSHEYNSEYEELTQIEVSEMKMD